MSEIMLTDKITVSVLVDEHGKRVQSGTDATIAAAARTSTLGIDAVVDPEDTAGLIRYLIRQRHSSPFRHGSITLIIHAPIFVTRQMIRHHVGVDWSEESARYHDLKPVFWHPRPDRPVQPATNHKPARPTFVQGTDDQLRILAEQSRIAYRGVWAAYELERANGIASEVARRLLPIGIYSTLVMTANPNALMNFLALRTFNPIPDAGERSYPQAEIAEVADQIEKHFAAWWPITYDAWTANGRRHL